MAKPKSVFTVSILLRAFFHFESQKAILLASFCQFYSPLNEKVESRFRLSKRSQNGMSFPEIGALQSRAL